MTKCLSFIIKMIIIMSCLHDNVNATLPDIAGCCRDGGASDGCIDKMCNVENTLDIFTVFTAFEQCQSHLDVVANCLTNGRDSGPCCNEFVNPFSDSNDCLALCNGTQGVINAGKGSDLYNHYTVCLTANVVENNYIYNCINSSYETIPGRPRDAQVATVEANSAELTWKATDMHTDKVTSYAVFYMDILKDDEPGKHNWYNSKHVRADSVEKHVQITDLMPDTRYEVFIRSLTDDVMVRSLATRVEFVTKRTTPKVIPFQQTVDAGVAMDVTILCYVKLNGGVNAGDTKLYWSYKDNNGELVEVGSAEQRYQISDFQYKMAVDGRTQKSRVMTLRIPRTTEADFREYVCSASFGIDGAGLATITLRRMDPLSEQHTIPMPRTILQCCTELAIPEECMGICKLGSKLGGNKAPEQALTEGPICPPHYLTTLQCIVQLRPFVPCCIRKQLIEGCLYMCDGSETFVTGYCLGMSISTLKGCRVEAGKGLPNPPSHSLGQDLSSSGFGVKWRYGSGATMYTVYYRTDTDNGVWQQVKTTENNVDITGLLPSRKYQVIVFSVNNTGVSFMGDQLEVTTLSND